MSKAEDADLVRDTLGGSTRAFEVLLERYERPVFNAAYRILGDVEEARDVAQSVFLRAWERLGSYDPRYRFFSWIYRIAINEALDASSRRRAQEPVSDDEPSPDGGPGEHYGAAESARIVRRALAGLPPDAKAVLVLRHYLDCSYREMAEILAIPEKTVKSRLFTARERLREILEAQGVLQP